MYCYYYKIAFNLYHTKDVNSYHFPLKFYYGIEIIQLSIMWPEWCKTLKSLKWVDKKCLQSLPYVWQYWIFDDINLYQCWICTNCWKCVGRVFIFNRNQELQWTAQKWKCKVQGVDLIDEIKNQMKVKQAI